MEKDHESKSLSNSLESKKLMAESSVKETDSKYQVQLASEHTETKPIIKSTTSVLAGPLKIEDLEAHLELVNKKLAESLMNENDFPINHVNTQSFLEVVLWPRLFILGFFTGTE